MENVNVSTYDTYEVCLRTYEYTYWFVCDCALLCCPVYNNSPAQQNQSAKSHLSLLCAVMSEFSCGTGRYLVVRLPHATVVVAISGLSSRTYDNVAEDHKSYTSLTTTN